MGERVSASAAWKGDDGRCGVRAEWGVPVFAPQLRRRGQGVRGRGGVVRRRRMMSVAWNTISAATAADFSISLDGISAFPGAISLAILKGC